MHDAPHLDDHTLANYRAAIYRIDTTPPVEMRIGERNAHAAALITQHDATSAVFVTAFNPYSRRLTPERNAQRLRALGEVIASAGLVALPGAGIDPKGEWLAEASFFVPGASRDLADAWLTRFEQNALVWIDRDGVPDLLLNPRWR